MNQDPTNRQRNLSRPEPRPVAFDVRSAPRRDMQGISRPVVQRTIEPVSPSASPTVTSAQRVQQVHIPYPETPVDIPEPIRTKSSQEVPKKGVKRWGLLFGAIILLAVAGFVGIDTWLTNNKAKAEVSGHETNQAQDLPTRDKNQEGSDEKDVSAESLQNYKVAADLPRIISIDKINLKARVLPMSVNTDGSIQAPININDSGWYTGSAKPGESGAMFIDGHASGATRMGLFAYLDTLKEGDMVSLEKGNGDTLKYRVVHVDVVPLEGIDMKKALQPYSGVTKGLNLMTCTGTWVPNGKTYDHRVIVYTEQVG